MKTIIPAIRVLGFSTLLLALTVRADGQVAPPPMAPLRPVTNSYFGVAVVDPFRWMEEATSPEMRQWMKAQSDYARATLAGLPARQPLLAELRQLDSTLDGFPGALNLVGSRYFYLRTPPPTDVYQLFIRDGLNGPENLVFDPQTLRSAGAGHSALYFYHPAPDGKYVVCPVARGGSEDLVLLTLAVDRRQLVDQPIEHASFTGWLPDSHGFFYSRSRPRTAGMSVGAEGTRDVCWHRLGTSIENDQRIFGFENATNVPLLKSYSASVNAAPGSSYLVAEVRNGVGPYCELYLAPLAGCAEAQIPWRPVCHFADEIMEPALDGDQLLLHSRKHAAGGQWLQVPCADPDIARATVLLPEPRGIAGSISVAQDALYTTMRVNQVNHLLRIVRGGSGEPQEIPLPVVGSISRIICDPRRDGIILALVSWSEPSAYYDYDPATGKFSKIQMPGDQAAKTEPLDVREANVTSADGTQVPLTVLCHRGLPRDGRRPTLLFGYGAYGAAQGPGFELSRVPWFDRGGVYAIAHVRGGGELGPAWQLAGQGPRKLNGVADFIACAEYLIAERYTSPRKLAARSLSAGGVLVGRALTERPDLFQAVVIEAGALDALRFEATPNGPPNIPEWGSVQTPEGFAALQAMSPYEHIQPGTPYPAVLLTTGINDHRVEPWQPAKMAARLAAATSSGRPILLSVNYDEGHFQTTLSSFYEHEADIWSFLLWQLGETGP